jgi:membrane protease YdiL (CAAX protease family)
MQDLTPFPPRNKPSVQQDFCRYCGSPLVAQYYFCLGCGSPYKHADLVVSAAKPMPLFEGELIRQKAPHVGSIFWTYFIIVFCVQIFAILLSADDRPDLIMFVAEGGILLATGVLAALHWPTLTSQLKRFGFFSPAAWIGLAALVPMLLFNYYFHGWVAEQLDIEHLNPGDELRALGFGSMTLMIVYCLIPAVTEELSFRGLVQHWLQVAIKPWRALVLASFLFAVLHFSVISFLYLFTLGMILGWMKLKTGSLYPSMLAHFLHNLAVIELFSGGV